MYNYPQTTLNQAGYSIKFTNFTDWTFADANYVPKSNLSTITLSTAKPTTKSFI